MQIQISTSATKPTVAELRRLVKHTEAFTNLKAEADKANGKLKAYKEKYGEFISRKPLAELKKQLKALDPTALTPKRSDLVGPARRKAGESSTTTGGVSFRRKQVREKISALKDRMVKDERELKKLITTSQRLSFEQEKREGKIPTLSPVHVVNTDAIPRRGRR